MTLRSNEASQRTMSLAKEAFERTRVHLLRPQDVSRSNRALRARGLSDSTRAKHLRVVGACLESAVQHGYAARNVVRDLPRNEKPRPQRKESGYYTDDELPRLFRKLKGVHRVLCEAALLSGMRLGELTALRWRDVDLVGGVIAVRRTWTDGNLGTPKNHERRDVDIAPALIERLGVWWGELGKPADETLVFPGEGATHLSPTTLLKREFYPGMVRAGIPREGPTGEKRTFHSLRHTFARIALENGAELTWVSRHLGHSGTHVTDQVYGHWSRSAREREAERLHGAFAGLTR